MQDKDAALRAARAEPHPPEKLEAAATGTSEADAPEEADIAAKSAAEGDEAPGLEDEERDEEEDDASITSGAVSSARRLGESFLLAVLGSTGLYLVGSVYTEAYYSRMSIEVNALNLQTTHVAVQAFHVLQALLGYPITFLVFWGIYRVLVRRTRWLRSAYGWARGRFERAVLLVTNLVIVTPLVIDASRAVSRAAVPSSSTIAEVSNLLATTVLVLVAYGVWISLGPRRTFFAELRRRRVIPIALLLLAYLTSSLIDTADAASEAASTFLLGMSDNSLVIEFTMRPDRDPLATDADLLLVTLSNGNYFVVERQPDPPSLRPRSYMVPMASVDFVTVQRAMDADMTLVDLIELEIDQQEATPEAIP